MGGKDRKGDEMPSLDVFEQISKPFWMSPAPHLGATDFSGATSSKVSMQPFIASILQSQEAQLAPSSHFRGEAVSRRVEAHPTKTWPASTPWPSHLGTTSDHPELKVEQQPKSTPVKLSPHHSKTACHLVALLSHSPDTACGSGTQVSGSITFFCSLQSEPGPVAPSSKTKKWNLGGPTRGSFELSGTAQVCKRMTRCRSCLDACRLSPLMCQGWREGAGAAPGGLDSTAYAQPSGTCAGSSC